ncbi:hypothetical protein BKA63DRAFT_524872 [Paraphoma chrysanthemicola]|nr:hypothetical protein BKA63DRAFT_524872 [Paraphoma chrysanthemicola]
MGLNHSQLGHSANTTHIPSHNVNGTTPVTHMSAIIFTPAVFSEVANALYEETGSGSVDVTSPTYLELMKLMGEFYELDIFFDDWLQNQSETMGPDVLRLVLQLFHSDETEEANSGLPSSSFPTGEEIVSITFDLFEDMGQTDDDTDDTDSEVDDLTEEEIMLTLAELEAVENGTSQLASQQEHNEFAAWYATDAQQNSEQAEKIAQLSFDIGAFISECTFLAKPDAGNHEDFAHHQAIFVGMKSEIVEHGIEIETWLDEAGVYVDLASSLPEGAQVMTFILHHFNDWSGEPMVPERKVGQAKASEFVDTLEKVEIASIVKEDSKCPHCWGRWDEEDDENRCKDPVKTPCGHLFGRACLVTALTGNRLRCPMCRQKMRAAA